jgi:hypothetical protein
MSIRPDKQSKKQQTCSITTNEEIQEDIEKDNLKKVFIETWGYYFNVINNVIFTTIKFIIRVSGIYLLWIVLHYMAAHIYVKLCVPTTIIGFIISPFMIATPHCQGLRWIIYNAAAIINNMWILMGAWICSTLLVINSGTPHE